MWLQKRQVMKKDYNSIVYTTKCFVTVFIPNKVECREAINMYVIGSKAVNKYKNGTLVPKRISRGKTKILRDAHYGIQRSCQIEIEFDVTAKGDFINFRKFKEGK